MIYDNRENTKRAPPFSKSSNCSLEVSVNSIATIVVYLSSSCKSGTVGFFSILVFLWQKRVMLNLRKQVINNKILQFQALSFSCSNIWHKHTADPHERCGVPKVPVCQCHFRSCVFQIGIQHF